MIDIIYKTVNPSHLKNLQILQNIKNRILKSQILVSSTLSVVGGNKFSK